MNKTAGIITNVCIVDPPAYYQPSVPYQVNGL